MALVLPEQQLLRACSSFLSNMIVQSVDCGLSQIIESIGEGLILRMLLSIGNYQYIHYYIFENGVTE